MPILIYRENSSEEEVAYFAANTWKLSKLVPALTRWMGKNSSKINRGKYVVNIDFIGNEKAELDDSWTIPRETLKEMARLGMALCLGETPNIAGIPDEKEPPPSPIRVPLKGLLNSLDRIFSTNPELGDTSVRERLFEVIYSRFITLSESGSLPDQFGMFTPQADKKVAGAVARFLAHPKVEAASKALETPKARLAAFQDAGARSREGSAYDEYFGHREIVRKKKGPNKPVERTR